MTIYQKELLKQLPKFNCTGQIDDESGMLHISMDGIPLCDAGQKNDLHWTQDKQITEEQKATVDAISNAAASIREYVSLYESAPPLGVESLPEYRRLAEYGDVVLGAMYSDQHGLLNALLTSIPDNKRIFTIESGSRELSLVRVRDGKVMNNVVHTLSRPSDNESKIFTAGIGIFNHFNIRICIRYIRLV